MQQDEALVKGPRVLLQRLPQHGALGKQRLCICDCARAWHTPARLAAALLCRRSHRLALHLQAAKQLKERSKRVLMQRMPASHLACKVRWSQGGGGWRWGMGGGPWEEGKASGDPI
eukprot:356771-Chlamydomonas_euryale.AAC.2